MAAYYKTLLPKPFEPFPKEALDGGIGERFERIAARYGDETAVKTAGGRLSYRELDEASRALAAHLLAGHGRGGEPVALLYEHGAAHCVAQLGVLRSGKCYAALDGALGIDRLKPILANLGARVLLCDRACEARAREIARECRGLEVTNTERPARLRRSVSPLPAPAPDDPACIVHTSGSTGPPQGVVISHRNILHLTRNHTNCMHLGPRDRATGLCPLWTGASACETFPVLLNGAALHPWSIGGEGVCRLPGLLKREAITMFTSVPAVFRLAMSAAKPGEKFPALRLLRLAGDRTTRLDVELFRRHCTERCLLRVGLGASEALMFAHFFIDAHYRLEGDVAPVGYPPEDFELLLLDEQRREVAPGEYGEIAVRSRYLSAGYWKNPPLTRQRFLPDPLDPSLRTYLTRDIGRLDVHGVLHHAGRCDSRVKIYGKMVLLSEIEQALLGIEGVEEAAVVPFDSGIRGTELSGFVVTAGGRGDAEEIRRALAGRLPPEIVPRKLSIVDALPLQSGNKINRLSLRELSREA